MNLIVAPLVTVMALHKKAYWGSLIYYFIILSSIVFLQIIEGISFYKIVSLGLFVIFHILFGSTKLKVPMYMRTGILFFMSFFLLFQQLNIENHIYATSFFTVIMYLFVGIYVLSQKQYLLILAFLLMEFSFVIFNILPSSYTVYLIVFPICIFLSILIFIFWKTNKTWKILPSIGIISIGKILVISLYAYFFIVSKI